MFPYSSSGSSVAMLHLIAKGVGEEAKKKFTFKTSILYIEDNLIFDPEYSEQKRIDFLNKIQQSVEYSKLKVYYSLLENVMYFIFFVDFFIFIIKKYTINKVFFG